MALEERLRLIVDATTGSAESSFDRLTTSAERTATAADTSAEAVMRSSDRVAQARNKEADAAGKLAVAQARLDELRDKGNASASQLVAAEERVASAQRGVQLAAANTATALEQQAAAQDEATEAAVESVDATDEATNGAGRFREEVGGLKGAVVGLVAGVSLADWVSESVSGFIEGARGAGQLATSMNATTEEAGRFLAVASQLGLEMDDLLEIQAAFAEVVANDAEALSDFGAEVKVNEDGTTNWALTLQSALNELQKIPDATERNARGFALFGEEGYKQLSRLLLSGKSVDEVFEAMGTPFTDADVESAREFDAAMTQLTGTSGSVSRELGAVLLPIITGMLQAFGLLVDVATAVPAPLGLAAAAAVILGLANRATAETGGLLATALAAAQAQAARFSAAAVAAAGSSGVLGAAMGGARVAAGGLVGVMGGPLGIALLAVAAGFTLLNATSGDNEEQAEATAKAQGTLADALRESSGVITDNVRQKAALAAQESGLLETAKRAGVAQGDITDALLGNEEAFERVQGALKSYTEAGAEADNQGNAWLTEQFYAGQAASESLTALADTTRTTAAEQQALAGELGETADLAAIETAAVDALTAALANGSVPQAELTRLAGEAATAQDNNARATDLASAAIEAHHAITDGAVESLLTYYGALYSNADAYNALVAAAQASSAAEDDQKTNVDEVAVARNNAVEAALRYADANADVAVKLAESKGQIVTALDEAKIRADTTVQALKDSLNVPDLTASARGAIEEMIRDLETAQQKGDIEALLSLTGVDETTRGIEEATEDTETTVSVKSANVAAVAREIDAVANANRIATVQITSRGGPEVDRYLDGLAKDHDRLALINVESRGGPEVDRYIDGIASQDRLAIIRVESRGGPEVDRYLDGLAADRTSRVNVARGAGAAMPAAYGAPSLAGAQLGRAMVANVTLDLEVTGRIDRGQLARAERGRATVEDLRAYERENGKGWRRD